MKPYKKYHLFFLFLLAIFLSVIPAPVSSAKINKISNFPDTHWEEPDTEKIKLNSSRKKILENDSFNLFVKGLRKKMKVHFKVEDSDILSLRDTAKRKTTVVGEACGTTHVEVTVRMRKGFLYRTLKTLRCEVTVGPRAISIKLKKDRITMRTGQKRKLKYSLKPNNTVEKPVFKSSNPACAAVSAKGKIRAYEPGVVRIIASISNGQSAVCTIKIKENQ